MHVIEVDDVSKRYGDVQALDGLSLSVERGTTLGVFGTNGAGKTTLFKLLVGLNQPDGGTVTVAGEDPTSRTAVREKVRYLPEHAGFPPNLTGREILRFHARMRAIPKASRDHHVERILHTVGLADAADRRVGGYSNGMNRRLGLGTALVGDPAVLILDEPTAGLDPDGIRAFHDVVEALAANTDVTIVFSSHALGEIERLCESAVIIANGDVAASGPVEQLRRSVDDETTVSISFQDTEAAARAAKILRNHGTATTVERSNHRVEATCPAEAAHSLLLAVDNTAEIQRFEAREPGLEGVFHREVGGESEEVESETTEIETDALSDTKSGGELA